MPYQEKTFGELGVTIQKKKQFIQRQDKMLYKCKIKKLDNTIEEAVLIEINGYELHCFISYCPFKIFENQFYEVELSYEIFNDYILDKSTSNIGFRKIDDSFKYEITAELKNNHLTLQNIQFEEDEYLINYSYLVNCLVTLTVDRISVSFIREIQAA